MSDDFLEYVYDEFVKTKNAILEYYCGLSADRKRQLSGKASDVLRVVAELEFDDMLVVFAEVFTRILRRFKGEVDVIDATALLTCSLAVAHDIVISKVRKQGRGVI